MKMIDPSPEFFRAFLMRLSQKSWIALKILNGVGTSLLQRYPVCRGVISTIEAARQFLSFKSN